MCSLVSCGYKAENFRDIRTVFNSSTTYSQPQLEVITAETPVSAFSLSFNSMNDDIGGLTTLQGLQCTDPGMVAAWHNCATVESQSGFETLYSSVSFKYRTSL